MPHPSHPSCLTPAAAQRTPRPWLARSTARRRDGATAAATGQRRRCPLPAKCSWNGTRRGRGGRTGTIAKQRVRSGGAVNIGERGICHKGRRASAEGDSVREGGKEGGREADDGRLSFAALCGVISMTIESNSFFLPPPSLPPSVRPSGRPATGRARAFLPRWIIAPLIWHSNREEAKGMEMDADC